MEPKVDKISQPQTNNRTIQISVPSPSEVKPNFEFGTVQISAIFIVILAAIAAYKGNQILNRRQRRITALDEFRTVFALFILELGKSGMVHFNTIVTERSKQDVALLNFSHSLKGSRRVRFNRIRQEYKSKIEAYEQHARGSIVSAFFPDFPETLENAEEQYKKELRHLIKTIFDAAEK